MNRNDPAEQMLTVLDVLWEELLHRTTDDSPAPAEEEITAALWQVHELVFAMAGELSNTYTLLERVMQEKEQRETVHSILFGPNGERL